MTIWYDKPVRQAGMTTSIGMTAQMTSQYKKPVWQPVRQADITSRYDDQYNKLV